MTIRRIALVVNDGKTEAPKAAGIVQAWAREHGVPCTVLDVWDELDGPAGPTDRQEAAGAGDPDLIVTIGGDGTLLRGVRVAASVDALVLGVDVGRVGFLTEVGVDELRSALDAVHTGRAEVEQRLTLIMRASRPLEIPAEMEALLKYGRGPELPPPTVRHGLAEDVGWGVLLNIVAANDVVVEKLARDRQASLAVYVSGRLFASYSADAVIVATPTGSTAYSFSAGGPVLSPQLDALIFTPVAAHMMFNRSLVLAADEAVSVRVLERSGRVAVSVDGQLRGVLDPGDWIRVYAGPKRARLARLKPTDFLARVRDRLGLVDARAALADGTPPVIYLPDEPVPPDMAHLRQPR
ncbi:MAG: kinase [Pseudonocardiales bacterium]|jgi:NAD+ kinase|nr:kinase [Pseudonocardiales bacterium]